MSKDEPLRTINEPQTEEEKPPEGISEQRSKGKTSPLNKDRHAFWLAVGCLGVYVVICCVSIRVSPQTVDSTLNGLLDLLKYVITTALGFFFATYVYHKD